MAITKAAKWEVLNFIDDKGTVTSFDLANRFDLSNSYAAKRLSILKSKGLIYDLGKNPTLNCGYWALTVKGTERLHYLCHNNLNILTDKEKRLQNDEWTKLVAQEIDKPFLEQKLWKVEDGKIRRIHKSDKFGVTFAEAKDVLKFNKESGS